MREKNISISMSMKLILKDDGSMEKSFDEDAMAKVLYHHSRGGDLFWFFDDSKQLSVEIFNHYSRGLFLDEYKIINNKRIVVFKCNDRDAISSDAMAFNFGFIVSGLAYVCILKKLHEEWQGGQ